jgi:hypothetical protein
MYTAVRVPVLVGSLCSFLHAGLDVSMRPAADRAFSRCTAVLCGRPSLEWRRKIGGERRAERAESARERREVSLPDSPWRAGPLFAANPP